MKQTKSIERVAQQLALAMYVERRAQELEQFEYSTDTATARALLKAVSDWLAEDGQQPAQPAQPMIEQGKTVIIETHKDVVIPEIIETHKDVVIPEIIETQEMVITAEPTEPSDQVTKPNFAEMLKSKHKEPVC